MGEMRAVGVKGGKGSGGWWGFEGVGVKKALGLSLLVGERTGRDMVGLAGGREMASLSLSLGSSLPGEAVREMWWEEVRIFSWLGWAREEAAAVHLEPVGPKWPRQGR